MPCKLQALFAANSRLLVKASKSNSNQYYYPASEYQPATLGGPVNPDWHDVRIYTRRDGTQVNGYRATDADGNPLNNYSAPSNVNPWH